jgi:hypothetical protein
MTLIWQDRLCIVILTTKLPKYEARTKVLLEQCREVGLDKVNVHYGDAFADRPNTSESDVICNNHGKAMIHYLAKIPSNIDILILEDDCVFLKDNIGEIINKTLSKLPERWNLLHLGHIALGPVLPYKKGIVNSTFPFGGHAYIIRNSAAKKITTELDMSKFHRPYACEGWIEIPTRNKFAIMPSIASQSELPKEMRCFNFINQDASLTNYMHATNMIMVILTIVVLAYISRYVRERLHQIKFTSKTY